MKSHKIKFIKKGIIFTVIFIFLLFIINQTYIKLIFNEKNLIRSQTQLENLNMTDIDVLFFGDSHPARSINPQFINNSFNYAVPSETYEQTYYKVRWIIDNYPNINFFVLPIDFHSFSNYRNNSYYDLKHWIKFMTYEELSSITKKPKINLFLYIKLPILGRGWEIFNFINKTEEKTEINLGWQKEDDSFTSRENQKEIGSKRVNSQFKKYPIIKEKLLTDSFYNTINLLQKKNKKIILIKYPLTSDYLNAIEKIKIDKSKFYDDLLNNNLFKNNNNIYILDYQNIYTDKSIFSDSDHLNYIGSEIFSKAINKDIKKIKNDLKE